MDEIGANVAEAAYKNQLAKQTAEELSGVTAKFTEAMLNAKDKMGKTPGVEGYERYSEEWDNTLKSMEEHAMSIAFGVDQSTSDIQTVDEEAHADYSGIAGLLSRSVNT
ncbi:hypothetical protein O4J56_02365 [Nocardiopsis sp. RSe5-2]|uniref:Uncharacterized protein n=1 Tax=Nocardiopsis endophytica TaxID=3018445 RepID=A0ABT4TXQ4_9ACTN|nr:hypothetical protein [Nocardiopsis endophytica]MDA2809471.1 hypothetical protein [Nocardiopsis endophytica]